jgi:Protein of unknown function (DUF4242)
LQVQGHHAADLAEQGKYSVEFLKYWFNESKGKSSCLVDAPSAEAAAQLVHRKACQRRLNIDPPSSRNLE